MDGTQRPRWLPPVGMVGRLDRWEPTVGGGYRMVLAYAEPDGRGKTTPAEDVIDASFVEIVPPERVVEAVSFLSDDPSFDGTMRLSWLLTDAGAGNTRVELRAEQVPHGIDPIDHHTGMAQSLAQLAEHVELPS